MKKYVIGLVVIGLITAGLAFYVVSLGTAGKQDKETFTKGQAAANKLNNYISISQEIPASLQEAGISDTPSTIRYSKLSDEKYEFCVTYKANRGFSSGDITSALYAGSLTSMANMSAGQYDTELEYGDASYLYLDYIYKKGENCQTVKPTLFKGYRNSSSTRPSYDTVTETSQRDSYQKLYDQLCSTAADYDTNEAWCASIKNSINSGSLDE